MRIENTRLFNNYIFVSRVRLAIAERLLYMLSWLLNLLICDLLLSFVSQSYYVANFGQFCHRMLSKCWTSFIDCLYPLQLIIIITLEDIICYWFYWYLVFCLLTVSPPLKSRLFYWFMTYLPLYLLKYFDWYKQYPKRELWQHREDPTKRYILICLCYSNELSPKCAKPHPNGFACVWAPRLHRDLVDDYRDKSIQIAESHFGPFWMKFTFSWNCARNPLRLPEFI